MDGVPFDSWIGTGGTPTVTGSYSGNMYPQGPVVPVVGVQEATDLEVGPIQYKGPTRPNPKHLSGCRMQSFFYDFYDRIHINPAYLDLGNLLSAQSRKVRVWNAFVDPKLLSNIGEEGTEGLTLKEPRPLPTTLKPLEELLFDVTISTEGPPVMDATYTFNFSGGVKVTLQIVGKRVVVWPFLPQVRFTEGLEWLTDIIKTRSQEQRLALRQVPRQTFNYDYQLDDLDFARAKQIATGWVHRIYGVPAWGELKHVGGIAGNPISLSIDTRWADWRVGGIALLVESADKFEACEIVSVQEDHLQFKIPVAQSFDNAFVMPLRFGRALSGFSFNRTNVGAVKSNAEFTIVDSVDLSGTDLDSYDGYPILMDRPIQMGGMQEKITKAVNTFDPKVGDMAVDPTESFTRQTATVAWQPLTREELWRVRRFLHHQRGRQKAFLLPTWNHDLQPLDNIGAGATGIRVKEILYHLYFRPSYVMLRKRNGETAYAKTISSTGNDDGSETIEFAAPLGINCDLADLEILCFLKLSRFDSDRVEMQYDSGGDVSIRVPTTEVPFYG